MANRLGDKIAVGDTVPVPVDPRAWPAPSERLRLVAFPHPMSDNLDPAGCVIEPSECQQIMVQATETGRYYTLGFAFRNEAVGYAVVVLLTGHAPSHDSTLDVVGAVMDGGL